MDYDESILDTEFADCFYRARAMRPSDDETRVWYLHVVGKEGSKMIGFNVPPYVGTELKYVAGSCSRRIIRSVVMDHLPNAAMHGWRRRQGRQKRF